MLKQVAQTAPADNPPQSKVKFVTDRQLYAMEQRFKQEIGQILLTLQLQNAHPQTPQELEALNQKAATAQKQAVAAAQAPHLDAETTNLINGLVTASDNIKTIAQNTPQKVVQQYLDDAQTKAEALRKKALEKASEYYAKAQQYQDQLTFDLHGFRQAASQLDPKGLEEVLSGLKKLGALLPDKPDLDQIAQAAQKLTRGGCWTPEMLATLPESVLPAEIKAAPGLVDSAMQKQVVEDASESVFNYMSTVMTLAISTGNPYVIAGALILSILAMIFGGFFGSGGGGSGSGDGSGDTKGKGQGQGDSQAPAEIGGNADTPREKPTTTPTKSANTKIDPGNDPDYTVAGDWPKLTFEKAGRPILKVDLADPKGNNLPNPFWTNPPYSITVRHNGEGYYLVYYRQNKDTAKDTVTLSYVLTPAQPSQNGDYATVSALPFQAASPTPAQ